MSLFFIYIAINGDTKIAIWCFPRNGYTGDKQRLRDRFLKI